MKVKCLNCGFKVLDSEEACPKCGVKLRWYQRTTPLSIAMMVLALFFFFFVLLFIMLM